MRLQPRKDLLFYLEVFYDGFDYEVSVAPRHLEKSVRHCLEDMLLYLYRVEGSS